MLLIFYMSKQETDSVLWHGLVWYVVVEKLGLIDTGEWCHHVIICRDRPGGRGQRLEVRRLIYSICLQVSKTLLRDNYLTFFFSFFFGKPRSAYLCPLAKVARKSQLAQDPEGILGEKLWDLCEALVREKVKDH